MIINFVIFWYNTIWHNYCMFQSIWYIYWRKNNWLIFILTLAFMLLELGRCWLIAYTRLAKTKLTPLMMNFFLSLSTSPSLRCKQVGHNPGSISNLVFYFVKARKLSNHLFSAFMNTYALMMMIRFTHNHFEFQKSMRSYRVSSCCAVIHLPWSPSV